ncbi:GAF and ANTAR domain-containing protein [Homoserinimonas sp. A447]
MAHGTREARLADLFVTLADTLVGGYDIVELLHLLVEECSSLLDVADAGIVLADEAGKLQLMASSSRRSDRFEVLQLGLNDGPCVESFATGAVVVVEDFDAADGRWPQLRDFALAQGLRSVHAVPLRLRESTIGAMNLFRERPGWLNSDDAATAKALADVATIGILHERTIRDQEVVTAQLQHALQSRVLIEQAKGVVSQARNVPTDEAFQWLREYARNHNVRLHELAEGVITRRFSL